MTALFTFLDNIYGVLFLPRETLTTLRNESVALQGGIVVVGINLMEGLRQGVLAIFPQVLSGIVGWFLLAIVLERLAGAFGKEVGFERTLGLTGLASLPWMFFAPALNFGRELGAVAALFVVVWFLAWQCWAIAIAMEVKIVNVLSLVPLAFAGSVVSFLLFFNLGKILLNVSNLVNFS